MALTFLCGTLWVHTQIFQSDHSIANIMWVPHQCVFFHLLTSLDHQSNHTCEVKSSFILTFYFHSMLLGLQYWKQSFICYQLSKDGRVGPYLIPPSTSYRPLSYSTSHSPKQIVFQKVYVSHSLYRSHCMLLIPFLIALSWTFPHFSLNFLRWRNQVCARYLSVGSMGSTLTYKSNHQALRILKSCLHSFSPELL